MKEFDRPIRGIAEVDLYPGILRLFKKHPHVFVEVPYKGKRIDLVFSTNKLKNLYAVEVKTVNWRRAIKQAALNQLFAQLSFVALPSSLVRRLTEPQRQIFRRHHVGLISVDNDKAVIEVEALRNGYLNLAHYRTVKAALRQANSSLIPKDIGVLSHAIANRSRTLDLLQAWADQREGTIQA